MNDQHLTESLFDLITGLQQSIECPVTDLPEVLITLVENGMKGQIYFSPKYEDCCSLASVYCRVVIVD